MLFHPSDPQQSSCGLDGAPTDVVPLDVLPLERLESGNGKANRSASGTAGGASNAVERAQEIGANTFQIFSSSPRMWRAPKVDPEQAERMRELRAKLDVGPLVIHTSYLVNVCSQTDGYSREER